MPNELREFFNLLKDKAYINGLELATISNLGAAEAEMAIKATSDAFHMWRKQLASERAVILERWYDLIMQNVDDLAVILTAEMGKPTNSPSIFL